MTGAAAAVAVAAALGYVVGLLLNVVIDRVPAREPLLPLRFRCTKCPPDGPEHPTLPLGRWLLPRRPCPACGERLDVRYWLVPLATAVLYGLVTARLGTEWALPAHLVLTASLMAISVIDLRLQIIPNRIVYPTIFATIPLLLLAAAADGDLSRFWRALLGASLAWLGLFLVHLISPGGMGFGDVRLSFVLGMFLAWDSLGLVLTGLFLGFLFGALAGVLLIALRIRDRKSSVPFGPFLAAGALVAILAADNLGRLGLGT